MTGLEMIKTIPVIKQIWDLVKNFSHNQIRIEVFPNQEFRKPCGTYWTDKEGVEQQKRPSELFDNDKYTAVSITNYGKKDARLDQITLNVYVKKGVFCKKTLISKINSDKFKRGFPVMIPSNDDERLTFSPKLDDLENDQLIYEVIAIINNRKIKHVHKMKALK